MPRNDHRIETLICPAIISKIFMSKLFVCQQYCSLNHPGIAADLCNKGRDGRQLTKIEQEIKQRLDEMDRQD